jgi:hypothetical protein
VFVSPASTHPFPPRQMGSNASKEEGTKKEIAVTDSSTKIQENSSGFHLIELHMPSMGFSLGLIGLLVLAYFALRWRRRYRKDRNRHRAPLPDAFPLTPSPPWPCYAYPGPVFAGPRFEEVTEAEPPRRAQGLPRPREPEAEDAIGRAPPAMARMCR